MSVSKFVLADPNVCIGCQTCMAACLSKHRRPGDIGRPRLNLVTTLRVSAPIACHHCDNAPCANVCPVGALYFDDGRVAIRQDRCIGCFNCEMACPFGAIDIVGKNETRSLEDLRFANKPFPVKCDLCYDRAGGPACVEACPTKGLRLVDADYRDEAMRAKRRAAALSEVGVSALELNVALV